MASEPAAAWCGGREAPGAKHKTHNNNTVSPDSAKEAEPRAHSLALSQRAAQEFLENTFAQVLYL